MEKFIIQDREAGNKIDVFNSLAEAEAELAKYEEIDKSEGTYTPDFYEIIVTDEIEEIKTKLENLEKLTDEDFRKILKLGAKNLDDLRKTNLKLANVKANEAITTTLLAKYNYKVECVEAAPASLKEQEKINASNVANSIIKKMEWWQ